MCFIRQTFLILHYSSRSVVSGEFGLCISSVLFAVFLDSNGNEPLVLPEIRRWNSSSLVESGAENLRGMAHAIALHLKFSI